MLRKRCIFGAAFLFCAVFLALNPASLQAEDIYASTYLELQVSSDPAVKFIVSQSFAFPFLRGSSPLTSGNNIATVLSAEFTPVSINAIGEVIWTPAAFFMLSGGGLAGSGWNMPLGYGIGINTPYPSDETAPSPRRSSIDGNAFDGLIWNAWGAATLQFDLGAVFPGYWNHVLFQVRQEFRYAAYTGASLGQSWVFENDFRNNQNGWMHNATYVIGYHMPLSPVFNTVAFMAESRRNFYNNAGGAFWGENLTYWIFSGIFNFALHPRLNMTLALQMHTLPNNANLNHNNTHFFYRDLELLSDDGRRRLLFHRAAVILNYRLR